MKILARAPNWIGDCLMALPALDDLSKNFPEAEIWVAAPSSTADIFRYRKGIRRCFPLSGRPDIKTFRRETRELLLQKFDIGVLFTNSFGSAWQLLRAKIPQRWGYQGDGRGLLLTRRVQRPRGTEHPHHVYYYLGLLKKLGLDTTPPRLSFPLSKDEVSAAEALLKNLGIGEKRPRVVINPGGFYGSAKRWPPANYAALGKRLQKESGAHLLLIGSKAERPLAESIASALPQPPTILSGRTSLRLLAGVMSLCDLCVTNDSGPMHLAVSIGLPTVAIFGPTDPSVTGPFHAPSRYIKKEVVCWPCSYRECPFDHRCMTTISPEEVWEVCRNILS